MIPFHRDNANFVGEPRLLGFGKNLNKTRYESSVWWGAWPCIGGRDPSSSGIEVLPLGEPMDKESKRVLTSGQKGSRQRDRTPKMSGTRGPEAVGLVQIR
ncbi:hypothetical protein L7F22_067595, partial [Adiantum nelumboides]|nr:hypothetical protein [Adiantum nelumboides]